MPEQLAFCFEAPCRRAKGEVLVILRSKISDEWKDIRDLVRETGMTRYHLHRALACHEFELKHTGLGRGHAIQVRRRLTPTRLDALMKPTSLHF